MIDSDYDNDGLTTLDSDGKGHMHELAEFKTEKQNATEKTTNNNRCIHGTFGIWRWHLIYIRNSIVEITLMG